MMEKLYDVSSLSYSHESLVLELMLEGPHQGSVVCPDLESGDAHQVVVAFLNGVDDGEEF